MFAGLVSLILTVCETPGAMMIWIIAVPVRCPGLKLALMIHPLCRSVSSKTPDWDDNLPFPVIVNPSLQRTNLYSPVVVFNCRVFFDVLS